MVKRDPGAVGRILGQGAFGATLALPKYRNREVQQVLKIFLRDGEPGETGSFAWEKEYTTRANEAGEGIIKTLDDYTNADGMSYQIYAFVSWNV